MHCRITPVCLLLISALVASSVQAAPLSLEAAIQRGLANNRELAAAALGAESARGRVEQAGLKPNPSFDAGARTGLVTGNGAARGLDLGFSQPIPLGGRLRAAQAVARVGIGAAGAELENRRRLVVGEITKAFVDVLALDRQVALRDRIISANQQLVDLSRARAKVGEVSVLDVNAAALELGKLQQEHASLLAERLNRLQELKPLLGASPDEVIEPVGDLDAVVLELSANASADKTTWNRPDLRLAMLEIERIEAEQRLARAEVKGDISVGATYTYDRRGPRDADHLLGARVSIPIPVRNKNQGRLRELRAERTRAQREVDALELAIASQVAGARQRAEQLQKILENYQLTVLPEGEAAEKDLTAAYQQGQVPLFQVIQIQQQRLALEAGALETRAAYARALVSLQTATGRSLQLANAASTPGQP